MAIQTGRPLGFVMAGGCGTSTVLYFGDAASAAGLEAMMVDAYVAARAIEEAPQASLAPAVFSPDIAARVATLRGEQVPLRLQLSMAGPEEDQPPPRAREQQAMSMKDAGNGKNLSDEELEELVRRAILREVDSIGSATPTPEQREAFRKLIGDAGPDSK